MDTLLTTRQLQDLLQVDRITIYRMLNEGRLRGFKVGGQWRFSQREIEVWLQGQQAQPDVVPGPHLLASTLAPLSQALPLSCVQAIQIVCAEALDIGAVTIDLDGTPLAGVSNSCEFCDQILATESGRRRCAGSWRQAANGKVYPCHAGLLCASAPIVVRGQPVALAALCQFVLFSPGSDEPAWQSHLPALAAGLGLDAASLHTAAGGVRAIPGAHLPRVLHLLQRIADALSEIGQERLNLIGRLQKIAEISEI